MSRNLTPAEKALVRIDKNDVATISVLAERNRFWDKVNVLGEDDCWEWTRAEDKDGYGKVTIGYRDFRAHRVSYILCYGIAPTNLMCHTCDNPKCCNPKHLFDGTVADNDRDRDNKGRGWWKSERNPKAKLTVKQVIEIREAYSAGGVTYRDLANAYGVGEGHMKDIVNRKDWSWV